MTYWEDLKRKALEQAWLALVARTQEKIRMADGSRAILTGKGS